MNNVTVTLSDGSTIDTLKNTTYYELSRNCDNADNIIGVLVGNKIVSLNDKITKNENIYCIE